jgi:nucleotidyltransferase/DNA polymerase involved in DNA repair
MDKLAIRKIPGIGNVAENVLNGLGIYTANDIVKKSVMLFNILSKNTYLSYLKKSLG